MGAAERSERDADRGSTKSPSATSARSRASRAAPTPPWCHRCHRARRRSVRFTEPGGRTGRQCIPAAIPRAYEALRVRKRADRKRHLRRRHEGKDEAKPMRFARLHAGAGARASIAASSARLRSSARAESTVGTSVNRGRAASRCIAAGAMAAEHGRRDAEGDRSAGNLIGRG